MFDDASIENGLNYQNMYSQILETFSMSTYCQLIEIGALISGNKLPRDKCTYLNTLTIS